MPSNSEALKALEQSAIQQKKELMTTVVEAHKQSLTELSKSLMNIHSTKLESYKVSFQEEIAESLRIRTWLVVSLTALVVLLIAIPSTWYITKTMTWEVPKNLRIAHEGKRYVLIEDSQLIQDTKTKSRHYLKIGEN